MCGILGILGWRREGLDFERALNSLQLRGPDASGTWHERDVILGHRRLAILDLSPSGAQPMASQSGRYIVSFNGEIYNFKEIGTELGFNSADVNSDTAIILAAIERWGVDQGVSRFRGMFAFALWDKHERKLILVRDRLGVKPLYFGWFGGCFVFASEIKPIKILFHQHLAIAPESVTEFFHYCTVPAPRSIYEGLYKQVPGTILEIPYTIGSQSTPAWFSPVPNDHEYRRYWTVASAFQKGRDNRFVGSFNQAVDAFLSKFSESVNLRMRSDVPFGAFLSGGIDSSLVVAAMTSQTNNTVRSFSVGLTNPKYDESPYAEKIAEILGVAHQTTLVTEAEALALVPYLSDYWDEPFADSSQIPTLLVSRFARRSVTVALSGDGGDELFLGYTRYGTAKKLWPFLENTPLAARSLLTKIFRSVPLHILRRIFPFGSGQGRARRPLADRLDRFASVFSANSPLDFCHLIVKHWRESPLVLPDCASIPPTSIKSSDLGDATIAEVMSLFDMETYLADDIMTKVDRASMTTSLEAREPFLDHHLVEFALSLPEEYRASSTESKKLLKHALARFVPRELFDRPKAGFSIPMEDWLRGGLREWAGDLLSPSDLASSGFLNCGLISRLWNEHLSGQVDHSLCLWDVLMFQQWYARWMKSSEYFESSRYSDLKIAR